jgi:1,4-dihydroxy-2-naphthoyl-CoA hydrolase
VPDSPDTADSAPATDALATGGFDGVVGLQLLTADGDRVTARLPIAAHLHQPYGIVHGGVYCSAVETTASVGGALWFGDRGHVVGVSNHTNFLRAVREGVLDVEATPVHRGRTQQLWQVTVRDEQDRLVARGEVRLANITPEAIGG